MDKGDGHVCVEALRYMFIKDLDLARGYSIGSFMTFSTNALTRRVVSYSYPWKSWDQTDGNLIHTEEDRNVNEEVRKVHFVKPTTRS